MKYIIFDMDGVIVNSEPVIMKAALDALKTGGIEASEEDFIPYIGAGEEHFIIEPCKRSFDFQCEITEGSFLIPLSFTVFSFTSIIQAFNSLSAHLVISSDCNVLT